MKKNSLKNKVWLYLLIFTFLILGALWFLQVLFLNTYYEWSKKSEIKAIAAKIKEIYKSDKYSDELDNIAFKEDICIEILDNNNIAYSTDSISRGCLIGNNPTINNYKLEFMKSNDSSITYKIVNPKFKNKTLIYGFKLGDDSYAFINTSLEPISSTVAVLKKQLIIVTVIVLIISFIIAYTISKKISKPIEIITRSSKEIAKGNYNVSFKSGTDIKEINELEMTLSHATEELSKTETLRRELMANVSHDLKTPLTLIKANAEMVKDLTYSNKEKRDKNLSVIIDEVDRLNLLVEDILDLSKMQSKSIELNKDKININDLIKSIIQKFEVLIERDGYSIEYKGFDYYFEGDKKKIEQAIYNLINNAINYTGEDKKIYVNLKKENDEVLVKIKDTGKGIDEYDLKYIWDKYYKVDRRYKRVTYGTGLGLSIVKNVFELHGFKYGVDSKKGKGTTFYFYIK